jgi:hypothetical protein
METQIWTQKSVSTSQAVETKFLWSINLYHIRTGDEYPHITGMPAGI